MELKIWYAATFLVFTAFTFSMIQPPPEPEWQRTEVVEDVDQRFLDLKIADDQLNLVYRNTSDTGVLLKTKDLQTSLTDSAVSIITPNTWNHRTIVDTQPGSGGYLSAAEISGELMVAYQDSSVGSEKVVLASRNGTEWLTETVEGVRGGGVNVGMYTSLTSYQENPMVLYHSPNQGLKAARKTDGEWSKQVIADDMGWFTSTTSCGDEVQAAYRGRNDKQLKISSFDGSWITEETNSTVKSSTSIDNQNCEPHMLYLSESEQITYRNPEGSEQKLADSDYSRVSIDMAEEVVHTSYYHYGEGIFHAEKTGEGWSKKKLTNSSNTAEYNDIAVDELGNVHLVYAQNSDIIHAEKNTGTVKNLRKLQDLGQILFGSILLGILANLGRKPVFRNQMAEVLSLLRR